jgi:hypothetical protein
MKRTIRKIAFRILLLLILGASCTFLYTSSRLLRSEKLSTLIENQLCKKLGIAVSISKADLNLLKGLHVSLSDFRIGKPADALFIKADRIGVDLSLLKLLFGELVIQHIDLESPEIQMLPFNLLALGKGSEGKISIPITSIHNGTILTQFKDKPYALTHINGHFSHDYANLNTRFFNTQLQFFARLVGEHWSGHIKLDDFPLKELDSEIQGRVDINIGFQEAKDCFRLMTDIHSKSIGFPGGGKPIEGLALRIICTADDHTIQFSGLELKTADLLLSGTGEMQGPFQTDAYGNTPFTLDFQSRSFDYETVLSHLPVEYLPEWAIPLFFHQIQGGSILINKFGFTGQLSDLIDPERLFNNLYVDAILSDLSYGAGYGPERITGISGTLNIMEGDLLIQGLSGYTDDSKLQCVNLILPDIMAPDLRTIVNVDLDMPLKEFQYLWKAGMEPKVVYDLLQPLSQVTAGNIKANVTVQDKVLNNATQIKGMVELDQCDFAWGKRHIEKMSGTVMAKNFASTILADVSGKLNQLPIRKFALSLADVFTTPRYQFSVQTDKLPKIPDFDLLPGASVVLTGSGEDAAFQGTAKLSTKGFRLFGSEYSPPAGIMEGSGLFSGTLWPQENIHFQKINVAMDSGLLDLEYHDEDTQGVLAIKGAINLTAKDREGKTTIKNIKGGLDLGLAWENNRPLSGHIQLKKISVGRNDSKMVLYGPIEITGSILSTTGLSLLHGDLKTRITGSLSLKKNTQYFTGELFADGFSISSEESELTTSRLPDSLTANIYIAATHPKIYEIPFEKGEARLQIEKGLMHFNDILITGESGRITGSMVRDAAQKTVMNIDLDLNRNGLKHLFHTFEPDETIMDGNMRLSGNLQGTTDSLNGHLSFHATDGYTYQSPLLSNIFAAMNLYKIFITQQIDIRKKHFTYHQISSNFTIKESVLSFDDFLMDSDSIQFSAVGQYRINEKEIHALIGVQPFETIDKAISAIPIVGWILTGEGGELFVICLTAEGSIKDPQISIAPNDTVSKPMANTLMRILKLPGKIISKPQELIRESQKK